MMPEHKETIIRRAGRRPERPADAGSARNGINRGALAESFHEHRMITVRLFDEYEDTELTGIVVLITRLDGRSNYPWPKRNHVGLKLTRSFQQDHDL